MAAQVASVIIHFADQGRMCGIGYVHDISLGKECQIIPHRHIMYDGPIQIDFPGGEPGKIPRIGDVDGNQFMGIIIVAIYRLPAEDIEPVLMKGECGSAL